LVRPTVTNPIGDVKSLFEATEIGLLADWNAEDFANKIEYIIENPVIGRYYGENARDIALTRYSWNILIEKLEEFYYELLNVHQDQ
jgi:glycosyltransferase involved in cell wall biosynthesis